MVAEKFSCPAAKRGCLVREVHVPVTSFATEHKFDCSEPCTAEVGAGFTAFVEDCWDLELHRFSISSDVGATPTVAVTRFLPRDMTPSRCVTSLLLPTTFTVAASPVLV
eukprot:CAMPEP_0194504154 /NCGR_PEP_ID=MMETSP0253-20130528/28787_1 /TAXON_ID=2966 /ORGANISM="Noctiluca scintillans" /LENGTH=108 /DNA_ID=CAMNT_0039346517 /DNA_START=81 /DNA_END=403 /DNA_ORIENTATION=+